MFKHQQTKKTPYFQGVFVLNFSWEQGMNPPPPLTVRKLASLPRPPPSPFTTVRWAAKDSPPPPFPPSVLNFATGRGQRRKFDHFSWGGRTPWIHWKHCRELVRIWLFKSFFSRNSPSFLKKSEIPYCRLPHRDSTPAREKKMLSRIPAPPL